MKKLGNFINKNMDKIIYICLSILVLNLIFYIFIGSKAIINSDSSFVVDYSIEQIETSSIFPKTWYNTNDFWIYSLIPIITPFVKMGVNLFTSRQIAVFVQTILFFVLLYDFYKKCMNDKKGLIIMLLLFLSGVSGQFMSEMFGDATYGTIVFYMLLELCLFIKYIKSDYKKKKYIIFFSIILLLLTACSLRFPVYIGAPLICVLLYFVYSEGINKKHVKTFAFIFSAILLGFLLNSYMKSSLLFVDNYTLSTVVSDEKGLVEDIGKAFFDYFFLCGATGKSIYSLTMHLNNDFISTTSPLVALNFIKVIYAFITLIIPFKLFKKIDSMKKEEKALLLYVSSFGIILVFFLVFCEMAYWHRYIFTLVFCLNLLYPMFYKYYFEKKKKDKIVFKIGLALVVVTSFIFSLNSYINISKTKLRSNGYQNLSEYLIENELYFGYSVDSLETNLFRTITNGKVQVIRLTRNGEQPKIWLSSTRWWNNDYKGKVFFYKLKENDEFGIEEMAIDKKVVGDFEVFIYENNKVIYDYLNSSKDKKEVKNEE